MSKSIRIRTTPNGDDKFVKINIEQDFDFVEILSLRLTQKELYTKFCADYGVIVGRVTVNNGFGVPNAKVSVFVPVNDIDKLDPEIYGEYPYETISDLNTDGVRYNLLSSNNDTNNECFTPVGSFPNKREFLDDDTLLDVYCEYYKFTTTTNDSGDYMIFGVPAGAQIMYAEADMSDIGIISQHPYDYIRIGSSEENFDSTTKFRKEDNLDAMNHIINRSPIGLDVQPFWGDEDNCNVMITRMDIDMKVRVTPSAIFIGSIFGDNEENSLNFKCRARNAMGILDAQTAGTGKIEMIRQTLNGGIERFDVKGGQVIDKDGTWAYQIPMNLDYRVTDEYGDLIPTDDPNKGVPTRANVRFRIGMDVSGGEGRLRTRGKYLVPHNPSNPSEVDYEFGSNTSPNSLATLKWNTIYSVKNHFRRYEATETPSNSNVRSFVGIKDVDSARGKYTPFPFNRLELSKDSLFNFICGLVLALAGIIILINGSIIKPINDIIGFINSIVEAFGGDPIAYVRCVTLECGDYLYAPGCMADAEGCIVIGSGVLCVGSTPYNDWHQTEPPYDAGYTHCVAMGLIESMNLLKFDFYNDWVNGTLYSPLFKYESKKEGAGPERFCESSCGGGGVNNNDPNNPTAFDNACYDDTYLIDVCTGVPSCHARQTGSNRITDGLIEKNGDTLYYAPYSNSRATKMFATDIISLGSSVKCHYDGTPFVQDLWIDTTYNMPPLLPEYTVISGYPNPMLTTSGMDSEALGMQYSLFVDVNCSSIQARSQQCGNIRRQCELGVGLDDYASGPNGTYLSGPDQFITDDEIDVEFSRNVFAWLNNETIRNNYPDPTDPLIACNWNSLGDCGDTIGTSNYNEFRYRNPNQTNTTNLMPRTEDSFYFYFGLNAASTAISKLRERYFTPCPVISTPNFTIVGTIQHNGNIPPLAGNGSIDVTVIGGQGPYNYFWTGPNGTVTNTPILGENNENGDIEDLVGGIYTLTVVDAGGLSTTTTFLVNDPQTLTCAAGGISLTLDQNGQINIDGQMNLIAQGGQEPYTFTVTNPSAVLGGYPITVVSTTGYETILGLEAGLHTMVVTDSSNPQNTCTQTVEVLEPVAFSFSAQTQDPACGQISNGWIAITPTGGTGPYSILVESSNYHSPPNDPAITPYVSGSFNNTALGSGTFDITVTDSFGLTLTQTVVLTAGNGPVIIIPEPLIQGSTGADGQFVVVLLDPDPNVNPTPQFTVFVDGVPAYAQTNPYLADGLAAGTYDVYISYQGCVSIHHPVIVPVA